MEKPIISVHIPKTGGSTFRSLLEKSFGENLVLDYGDRPYASGYSKRVLENLKSCSPRYLKNLAGIDDEKKVLIHGHFLASKYSFIFPNCRKAVWLRDPVERLCSHYFYWKRNPDPNNELCRFLISENLTLKEFSELPKIENFFSFYLNGQDIRGFDFIGITEFYEKSLALFKEVFEIDLPEAEVEVLRNPDRKNSSYELDSELRQELMEVNSKDYFIFEEGKKRFHLLCGKFGL